MAKKISDISVSAAFFLPIYCARTPKGKRMIAPARIGTEIMKPFSAGLKLKCSLMNGAIAPFNTQIAKQKSKYKKAENKVGGCPAFKNVLKFDIRIDFWHKSTECSSTQK